MSETSYAPRQASTSGCMQPATSYRGLSAIEKCGLWPAAVVSNLPVGKCYGALHRLVKPRGAPGSRLGGKLTVVRPEPLRDGVVSALLGCLLSQLAA